MQGDGGMRSARLVKLMVVVVRARLVMVVVRPRLVVVVVRRLRLVMEVVVTRRDRGWSSRVRTNDVLGIVRTYCLLSCDKPGGVTSGGSVAADGIQ